MTSVMSQAAMIERKLCIADANSNQIRKVTIGITT